MDLPDIKSIELQKLKVANSMVVGSQFLADAKLKKIDLLEHAAGQMLLALESKVLAHEDGTAEQRVWVDVEVGVSWRQILSFLFGGKRTVKDQVPVKVKARKWTMFPENNMVFPPALGNGVVRIETWAEGE